MRKEKLVCQKCRKGWQRVPSRGRKPVLCPSCLSSAKSSSTAKKIDPPPAPKQIVLSSKTIEPEELPYPAPTKWLCSSCGASVQILVGLKYPPTHHCAKRLRKLFALELVRQA